MELDDYKQWTRKTAIYPKEQELPYLMLGLTSEVGEVADKLKKHIRDRPNESFSDEQIIAIQKELGDVFWYLARLHDHFGISMQHTILTNVDKLSKRLENNTISGSGDNR